MFGVWDDPFFLKIIFWYHSLQILVLLGLGYHHYLKKVPRRRNPSKIQFLDPKSKIAPPNPVVWQKKECWNKIAAFTKVWGAIGGQQKSGFHRSTAQNSCCIPVEWLVYECSYKKRHCYNPHSTGVFIPYNLECKLLSATVPQKSSVWSQLLPYPLANWHSWLEYSHVE